MGREPQLAGKVKSRRQQHLRAFSQQHHQTGPDRDRMGTEEVEEIRGRQTPGSEAERRGPEASCQRHHTGLYQCGRGRDERPRGLLSASLHRLLSVGKRKRGKAPRPSVSVTTPAVINEEEEERRGQKRLSARPRGLLSVSSHRPMWKRKRGEADKRLAQRPRGLLPASPQRPVW